MPEVPSPTFNHKIAILKVNAKMDTWTRLEEDINGMHAVIIVLEVNS